MEKIIAARKRAEQKKTATIFIANPDSKGISEAHSEDTCTLQSAMVDYWMYAVTPWAPMKVWVRNNGDTICNDHLLKRKLTMNDVPEEIRELVARALVRDLLICMDSTDPDVEKLIDKFDY